MMRILLAVDGSENSWRALERVLRQRDLYKQVPELHLINVQPSLRGSVTMFVSREQVTQYHEEEGTKALAVAREKLDKAGAPYTVHVGVGEPAQVIANYAVEKACDHIVMGTRGMGAVTGMLLGSVAAKVVYLSDVPVLLVK